MKTGIGKSAYGMAPRHIVEVAAYYHVGTTVEPQPLHNLIDLARPANGGCTQLVEHELAVVGVFGRLAKGGVRQAKRTQVHIEYTDTAS